MGRRLRGAERLFTRFYERVPDDPILAPVFAHMDTLVAYLEWGTRLAVINSQPGATVVEDALMPAWGGGVPGGPDVRPTT